MCSPQTWQPFGRYRRGSAVLDPEDGQAYEVLCSEHPNEPCDGCWQSGLLRPGLVAEDRPELLRLSQNT